MSVFQQVTVKSVKVVFKYFHLLNRQPKAVAKDSPVNPDQSQHPKATTKISESHPRQGIYVCSSIGVLSEFIGVTSELYRS